MFPSVFVEVKLVIKRQVGVRRFAADMSSQHNVGGHARRMDKDTVVIVARSVSQPNIDGFVTAVFNHYTVDVTPGSFTSLRALFGGGFVATNTSVTNWRAI